ncbi:isochorismatase family protein [Cohnella lubricantis]|uniref:Isochorismatase family protein n=1 Tax=Cohnella lubricantis TaxID=2163172 RepID=A0A841TEV5_9BACL|nr:isochorismatase family protein [Cohnella lubricantis]MBB6677828.1 isochorismatase family protein [Cohnella lubricantis]MBP2120497.1 nicotinamidase-related amidase [Cohnella lubricantis]
MKIGFLVIDMQAIHLQGVEQNFIDVAAEHINYVADVIRSNGHVVVHIQDIEGMEDSNKDSFNIIPDIQVEDSDLIVTKEASNSFWQTNLEQLLKERDVELLIISGFAAEHCVLFTYNGAAERGFRPVLLQNGILSRHPDIITSTYRDRNLISHPVIKYLVR